MNPLKCLISGLHSSDYEELLSSRMNVTGISGGRTSRRLEKIAQWAASEFVLFTKYRDDQIKED
jgi:hypothetical protein